MFRYHRVLYRRLLRAQSSEQLSLLRRESGQFPEIARMIEDELARRIVSRANWTSGAESLLTAPLVAQQILH